MELLGVSSQEEQQKVQLTRMRRNATGLLVLMAFVFIGARLGEQTYSWLSFFRAFAEAAMVGALADWFAVTALFRHPLGLPIPHTAIIPRNKDRIGNSLGTFVQNNFLSPEILAERLRSMDIAGKAAEWLAHPDNSAMLAEKISAAIPDILNAFHDEDVHRFIEENITSRIRAIEVAPLAGTILSLLTADNRHQQLFNEALRIAEQLLEENKPLIRTKIKEESPWYVPEFVDSKLYEKIISKAEDTLREVNDDPNHELRRKFHIATQEFIEKLKTSPEYKEKGELLKEQILQHPIVQQYFSQLWTDLKAKILKDIADPNSSIRAQIRVTIARFGESLVQDEAMRHKVNVWIQEAALHLVSERRGEIAALISDTVRKWDTETVTRKMELQVGKDLQYIRINGTLVGGLVGLLLYIFSQFFP